MAPKAIFCEQLCGYARTVKYQLTFCTISLRFIAHPKDYLQLPHFNRSTYAAQVIGAAKRRSEKKRSQREDFLSAANWLLQQCRVA